MIVSFFSGSHFSFLRLEPKSLSFGFSLCWDCANEFVTRPKTRKIETSAEQGIFVCEKLFTILPLISGTERRHLSSNQHGRIIVAEPGMISDSHAPPSACWRRTSR